MEIAFAVALIVVVAAVMGGIGVVVGRMLAPHVERLTEERNEPDDDAD
jgi:hypothetical protein